jgi:hypothetical protein
MMLLISELLDKYSSGSLATLEVLEQRASKNVRKTNGPLLRVPRSGGPDTANRRAT